MSRRYQSAILTASYNGLQVPNAPTIGTATAGAGSASVTFTAPSNVGGSAITSYTVISSPGSITGTGASSPVTVSGLTNGTAYTFTVVATNAYGSGPASAASNSVTPAVNYIESVFSTYLYTGNSSTQTITNGIDLSGNGGLVWIKNRQTTIGVPIGHILTDTVRGVTKFLRSQSTSAQETSASSITAFNSSGFSFGSDTNINYSGDTYASWTFREQAKFFDVVTYTGNATAGRTVAHNLGSVPGCIIIKKTTGVESWAVYHRSLGTAQALRLNLTNAASSPYWNGTSPTDTVFTVDNSGEVNDSGATYVAYLFAHDAGGFGLTGTDNVISCGSFTTDGSGNATVSLGYEPQWLLLKRSSSTSNWAMQDTMRGWTASTATGDQTLYADLANAEVSQTSDYWSPTSTGFTTTGAMGSGTYIYIAIRRGPMAVPTLGTSVFTPILTGSGSTLSDSYSAIGFPIDMTLRYQTGTNTDGAFKNAVYTRLIGINSGATDTPTSANNPNLLTHSTAAEIATYYYSQTGSMGLDYGGSWSAPAYVLTHLHFKRAPGFFDVVCYTGTGSNTTQTHNLGVVPELMLVKSRSDVAGWACYSSSLANTQKLRLDSDGAAVTAASSWNSTTPTSSVFSMGTDSTINGASRTYVNYLFATCPGVSKVGSYTGTGALQTINCAFTTGARYVLIKRTDSTGDWYVWDSARGITAGNDPYLFLNSTAAEVTGTNYIDSTAAGFQVTAAAPAGLNAVGGTYIFLAIA